jgi:hypothetical protein
MTEHTHPDACPDWCVAHVDGRHVGINIRTSRFQISFDDWDALTDHDRATLGDSEYLRWIDGCGPRPAHI